MAEVYIKSVRSLYDTRRIPKDVRCIIRIRIGRERSIVESPCSISLHILKYLFIASFHFAFSLGYHM